MAEHKDYGLTGVNQTIQLGKQGPHLKSNGDGTFNVVDGSGSSLTKMGGGNATASTHFVTKSQLDSVVAGSNAGVLTLGASTDSSWTDGAVQSLTTSTSVTEAIDALNEGIENVRNNTFVKSVDATVTSGASGGAPLSTLLSTSVVGNANRYTIDWGDGSTTTGTTDSTPSHTYTDNTNSPFDVTITAFNNQGSGTGSSATIVKTAFVSLFTGDPVVDFAYFAASSGGSAITDIDAGSTYYLENTTTNIGGATIQYTIDWGDSQSDETITDNTADGGSAGGRLAHTFDQTAETERSFTTEITLDSHSTADASVIPTDDTLTIRQYATHTPEVSLDDNSGINESATSGHVVTFTNGTENTIGNYSTYGIRYKYQWGDGTSDSYVNTGTGASGDTGGTIDHTFTLSSSDQANGVAQDYTGNLSVMSNHTSSPFVSANFTVHVEPDVRVSATASSTTSNLRASGDHERTVYKGTDLSGNNRAIITLDNNTQNGDFYNIDWGDTTSSGQINEAGAPAGSVAGANITHDYGSATTGNKSLVFAASGTPDITAQTSTQTITIKVEDVPAAPTGLSGQQLTWSTSYDRGGKLASGATNNTGSAALSDSASLETGTIRRYGSDYSTINTNTLNNVYDSSAGTLSAKVNGSVDGTKTFTTSTGETGSFTSLIISGEGDAYGQISSSTYPQNFYQVFDAKIQKNISSLATGVHSLQMTHSSTGDTNLVHFVKDNVIIAPTLNTGGVTMSEETAGTYRYISGIPYYHGGSPVIRVSGLTVNNLVGEAYLDSGTILQIDDSTRYESTSQDVVGTAASYGYSDIDGASTMLSSGVPIAQTGVGTPYALGDLDFNVSSSTAIAIQKVKARIQNLDGYGAYSNDLPTKIQLHSNAPQGFDESAVIVDSDLGAGFDDYGKRVTGFSGTGDTPTIASATNFYTSNAWSGAQTVAGTSEAIIRLGTLQHYTEDLSTGYLPVGPDLNTGRSGAQYFTFAFRRTTMSNFTITLTGTISGMFIAAPGTNIDDASTLNGWVDCSTTYGGAGTPGADTGNGGNGSNGCAFTSGDRIVDGTAYSGDDFTFTLGDQNATNSTGNNVLVRIKLEAGDSLTNLSIDT